MRLSTRARYAVRAMVDLALHSCQGPVSRADIVERQGISADYIAHLFARLQEAGLVRSTRGRAGGYVLGRDPAQICVGEIIRLVEGPVALTDCTAPGGDRSCPRAGYCITRRLWLKASEAIADAFDGVTLADLCAQTELTR